MSKFTRRELAVTLSGSAVLLAQAPQSSQPSADDELKSSLAQLQQAASQLDGFPLPMTAEPATIFKP